MIKRLAKMMMFAALCFGGSTALATDYHLQAYPGWDAVGNDFDSFPSGNAANCSQACKEKANCKGSVFVGSTGRCWLKHSIGSFSQLGGATLYLKSLAGKAGIDYPGGDYHSYVTNSWQSCSRACFNQSRCKAFTYVTQTSTCWLKDQIVDADFLDGAVSGRK